MLEEAKQHLIGRTITDIRHMDKNESDENDWYLRPVVITLDDGSHLVPMSNDEGNKGGSILVFKGEGEFILPVAR